MRILDRSGGVAGLLLAWTVVAAAQSADRPFVAVGVAIDNAAEFAGRKDLEYLRALRFTVVARRDPARPSGVRVDALTALLGEDSRPLPRPLVEAGELEILPAGRSSRAADVRQHAWVSIGRSLPAVLFEWRGLRQNAEALAEAATFADNVTRNAALFAMLGPSSREVRVDLPASNVFARFVESGDAIVLIAANLADLAQTVTMTFPADTPEAIWQNMESGAVVNFVAGPRGPRYTRTFAPRDVVVLMIRKPIR